MGRARITCSLYRDRARICHSLIRTMLVYISCRTCDASTPTPVCCVVCFLHAQRLKDIQQDVFSGDARAHIKWASPQSLSLSLPALTVFQGKPNYFLFDIDAIASKVSRHLEAAIKTLLLHVNTLKNFGCHWLRSVYRARAMETRPKNLGDT